MQQHNQQQQIFVSGEDDHGGFLSETFPIPLPISIDDGQTTDSGSQYEHGSYNTHHRGHDVYHDPLQPVNFSGVQLQELDKQSRSDQMKLTFIMDTVASEVTAASSSPAPIVNPLPPISSVLMSAAKGNHVGFDSHPVVPRPIPPTSKLPATLVPSQANKRIQACSSCGLVFAVKSKALFHLYTEHPEAAPGKVYPCSSCDNAFLRKSDMTKHFDCVHLRLRPSRCSECPSAFFFRKDLVKHVRTVHEKRRDHECPIVSCGRRFGKREHLKRHMIALHSTSRQGGTAGFRG